MCLNPWKLHLKRLFGTHVNVLEKSIICWSFLKCRGNTSNAILFKKRMICTVSQKRASSTNCTLAGVVMSLSPNSCFWSDHHYQWHFSIFTRKIWDTSWIYKAFLLQILLSHKLYTRPDAISVVLFNSLWSKVVWVPRQINVLTDYNRSKLAKSKTKIGGGGD